MLHWALKILHRHMVERMLIVIIQFLLNNFDTQATKFKYWYRGHRFKIQKKPFIIIDSEFNLLKSPSFCLTFLSCLGSKLSAILRRNPEFIEELCLCLDRNTRLIHNWRRLALILDVDLDVIRRLGQYGDFSPTIRLFDFLAASNPDLTIKKLKDTLREIGRNDLVYLLIAKGNV